MRGTVWIVAGPPGAGKTTVARLLAVRLSPPGALLDKDTLYGGFAGAVIAAAGRPAGLREGPWYDQHVKTYEYAGLAATTRDIRGSGCPVVVVAPFTAEIHDPVRWSALVDATGGPDVRLVWVAVGPAVLRDRLTGRGSGNDVAKLADYDAFVARMQPGRSPAVPHLAIDNLGPIGALDAQVTAAVAGSAG